MEDSQPVIARLWFEEIETLLCAGQQLTLGRAVDSSIVLTDPKISRSHALIEWNGSGFSVRDLGSVNGTFVNGERLADAPHLLRDGDTIALGEHRLAYEIIRIAPVEPLSGMAAAVGAASLAGARLEVSSGPDLGQAYPLWGELITIGRASREATWEIRLTDRSVSRPHARIEHSAGCFCLLDLESANGTRLNGQRVPAISGGGPAPAIPLHDGDQIAVGDTVLVFYEK